METIVLLISQVKCKSTVRNIASDEPIDFYNARERIMENMVKGCMNYFYLGQVESSETEKEAAA